MYMEVAPQAPDRLVNVGGVQMLDLTRIIMALLMRERFLAVAEVWLETLVSPCLNQRNHKMADHPAVLFIRLREVLLKRRRHPTKDAACEMIRRLSSRNSQAQ